MDDGSTNIADKNCRSYVDQQVSEPSSTQPHSRPHLYWQVPLSVQPGPPRALVLMHTSGSCSSPFSYGTHSHSQFLHSPGGSSVQLGRICPQSKHLPADAAAKLNQPVSTLAHACMNGYRQLFQPGSPSNPFHTFHGFSFKGMKPSKPDLPQVPVLALTRSSDGPAREFPAILILDSHLPTLGLTCAGGWQVLWPSLVQSDSPWHLPALCCSLA